MNPRVTQLRHGQEPSHRDVKGRLVLIVQQMPQTNTNFSKNTNLVYLHTPSPAFRDPYYLLSQHKRTETAEMASARPRRSRRERKCTVVPRTRHPPTAAKKHATLFTIQTDTSTPQPLSSRLSREERIGRTHADNLRPL